MVFLLIRWDSLRFWHWIQYLVYNCTGSGIYTMQTMSFNSVKGNTIYLVQNGLYLYANNYFSVANFSDNRIFSYSLQGIYVNTFGTLL
jgi:hypothetical protein